MVDFLLTKKWPWEIHLPFCVLECAKEYASGYLKMMTSPVRMVIPQGKEIVGQWSVFLFEKMWKK